MASQINGNSKFKNGIVVGPGAYITRSELGIDVKASNTVKGRSIYESTIGDRSVIASCSISSSTLLPDVTVNNSFLGTATLFIDANIQHSEVYSSTIGEGVTIDDSYVSNAPNVITEDQVSKDCSPDIIGIWACRDKVP
ncbi:MAG: hypothetical protein ACLGHN_13585, partial [Bacteriovoracia bacterium]